MEQGKDVDVQRAEGALEENQAASMQQTGQLEPAQQAAMPETAPIPVAETNAPGLADVDQETMQALRDLEEKRKKKRRSRIVKILVVVGVILLLLLGSCVASVVSATSQMAPTYEYATAQVQDFTTSVQVNGAIRPEESSVVTPETSGIIEQVLVSEGQWVEQGQTLFTLKNDDLDKAISDAAKKVDDADRALSDAWNTRNDLENAYQSAVDSYNDAIDQNASAQAEAQQAAEAARTEAYNKAMALIPKDATAEQRKIYEEKANEEAEQAYAETYAAYGIADPTPIDHASYVSQIDTATASINTAQSTLSAAQDAYNQAVENGNKRLVKAPRSGVVLSLSAVAGASVGGAAGGTSTASGPLATIADLGHMKVSCEVNEADISSIAMNQKAQLTFMSLPDLQLDGVVTGIASVASGTSSDSSASAAGGVVTYKVEVLVEHPDEHLKPGMSATVSIITQEIPGVIVLPATAVTDSDGVSSVQVAKNVPESGAPVLEERQVTVTARSTSQVAITSGLQEGETVVTRVSSPALSADSTSSSAA